MNAEILQQLKKITMLLEKNQLTLEYIYWQLYSSEDFASSINDDLKQIEEKYDQHQGG